MHLRTRTLLSLAAAGSAVLAAPTAAHATVWRGTVGDFSWSANDNWGMSTVYWHLRDTRHAHEIGVYWNGSGSTLEAVPAGSSGSTWHAFTSVRMVCDLGVSPGRLDGATACSKP